MIWKLKELVPELQDMEWMCRRLAKESREDRLRYWRLIRELLYHKIGWGREPESIFVNFLDKKTVPILSSSEAWCCVTAHFRELLLGE
jgi:hypothetical protein